MLIRGKLYKHVRDPEGLLGTVPAIGTALAGAVTGRFLKNPRFTFAVALVTIKWLMLYLFYRKRIFLKV